IWVRNHWDGGWITVYWKHLHRVPVPFGELAWNHARQDLADRGEPLTETAIADAVAGLLDKASHGPASAHAADPPRGTSTKNRTKRQRGAARTSPPPAAPPRGPPTKNRTKRQRVAARTHATMAAGSAPERASPPGATPDPAGGDDADDAVIAEVVP